MIEQIVLIITLLLFLMVFAIILKAIIKKQSIFGRPTLPIFFFILAKISPFGMMIFLLLRGLKVDIETLFIFPHYLDIFALALLIMGTFLFFKASFTLKDDLIFGLSSSESHQLRTTGIYSYSRHPFYLGFLLILVSSCMLMPNIFNIILFAIAWLLHHFIMIKEEQHLISQYGDTYIQYMKKVNRYLTIKL